MKNLNRILFSLISPVVLGGDRAEEPRAVKADALSAVYAHAKRHDLGHLLAQAVRENAKFKIEKPETEHEPLGDDAFKALMAELEKSELTAVWRVKNIENEQGRVRKCLEDAGIPFILLKGAVVRGYYPAAWMRTSSDIDVLVHSDAIPEVVKSLKDVCGYKVDEALPHAAAFYSASGVRIEVMTDFEGDGEDCRLLNAAWRDSSDNGGAEHFLTPEHYYFYHVAHMASHMRSGGCGIRPFIDLYLINAKLDLNRTRINEMLAEFGLSTFESAAVKLSEMWMLGRDTAELSALEEYVLAGGVYGTVVQGVAANRRGGQGKFRYVMRRIFMPYSELKKRHPALDGRPWLTPFFEVWRWCGLVVPSRFKRSRAELKSAVALDNEGVTTVESLLDSLGI